MYTKPVFFLRAMIGYSNKLGIVNAIHVHAGIVLDFSRVFFIISPKKGSFWCWLSTDLVYTETVIDLKPSFGK